jgi:glycosyltransferase involved in cell wall biosynthesis
MVSWKNSPKAKVAFVGSYSPRKCGIATFTRDLVANIRLAAGDNVRPEVYAMETDGKLAYTWPVRTIIRKNCRSDYIAAADLLNFSGVDLVCLQYEFGLFDGRSGSFLPMLLRRINKPLVTTVHTVLEKPEQAFFDSMVDVCRASDKIVVMNECGVDLLENVYDVPPHKIELIGHGIPDLPFADTSRFKQRLGFAGRKTILTFGLLSRNKGIEFMLKAMPDIVRRDPSALYIVLGATHPEVIRHEGHVYKNKLDMMVHSLGLEKHVIFEHRFVDDHELLQHLSAADVYVTPYLNKEQLTSGTLAFAVGTGRAVVSTPYWAARELLAAGRGKLVDFGDTGQMARAVHEILANPVLAMRMRTKAYEYGRAITWPRVGEAYWQLFEELLDTSAGITRPRFEVAAEAFAPAQMQIA